MTKSQEKGCVSRTERRLEGEGRAREATWARAGQPPALVLRGKPEEARMRKGLGNGDEKRDGSSVGALLPSSHTPTATRRPCEAPSGLVWRRAADGRRLAP